MSIGTIQLGQCGNQLGQSLYQFLINESQNAPPGTQALINEQFFFNKGEEKLLTAKAVLIDMEPKVVNRCLQHQEGFNYSQNLAFSKQEGSGNNWGYGYNVHGPKTKDQVGNCIRNLFEISDFLEGLLLLSSFAGGTGSGVGSYVQELLQDEYPHINVLNICVLPHLTGEVILQSLNSTLTISHLYNNSQGIIMLSNDEATQSCNHLLDIPRPSLEQINSLMSVGLGSVLFPTIGSQPIFSTIQNGFRVFEDIIETLLLDTRFKLLQIRHIPQMPSASKSFSNDTWISLEKRITQIIRSGTHEYNINWNNTGFCKSSKSLLVARGHDVLKHNFQMDEMLQGKLIKDTHQFNGTEKSISSLNNSPAIVSQLEPLAERATKMIKENAYLYQYEKFGVTKDDFIESIAIFESIIQNYEKMRC